MSRPAFLTSALALATAAGSGVARLRSRARRRLAGDPGADLAQRRLAAVLEHAPDAMVISAASGDLLWCSRAFERMFGRRPTPGATSFLNAIHPDDRARVVAARWRASADPGTPFRERVRVWHGEARWVSVGMVVVDLCHDESVGGFVTTYTDLSQLDSANEELAASGELHRFLSENATDLLLRVSVSGTITFASSAARPLLGCSPDGLHGARLDGIVHAADRAVLAQVLEQAAASGAAARHDLRLVDGGGGELWVEASVQRVISASGEHEYHVSMRDVEDRRGAQQALEVAEARQRLILDLLDEGVVLHHREHGLVEVNPAASRMLGVVAHGGATTDQIAPRLRPYELDGSAVDPLDLPSVRALRTGRADHGRVLELRYFDGSTSRFMEVDTVPTGHDADGRPTMALSTFRDVTDQRAAAAALVTSETRFRLLAENTHDLVTLTDGADRFAYVSPSVGRVMGFTPEEVIGRHLHEVLGPGELDRLREALGTGTVLRHELVRADGSCRWLETIAHEVPAGHGGPAAIISSSRDVTERVVAERALAVERHLLDTCLARLHSGVLAVDGEGTVLHVNDRHRELFELDICVGESLASLRNRTALLAEDGGPWRGERPITLALAGVPVREIAGRIARSDGTHRDVVLSAEPLVDAEGSISGAVLNVHDVSELRAAERELRALAGVDQLTGLPNRRQLVHEVELAVERCRRHPERLLVCFIDLDGFKDVNDRLGHQAGDELLRRVGQRITDTVRTGDFVARLGGDEFVVIAEDLASSDDGAVVARRLEDALSLPFVLAAGTVRIGASVGVRALRAGDTPASLIADADRSMYLRKARRREVAGTAVR